MSAVVQLPERALRAARYIIEAVDPAASLQFDYDQQVHDLAVIIDEKAEISRLERDLAAVKSQLHTQQRT